MAKKVVNKTKVSNTVESGTKLATSEELGVAAPGPIESIDDEMEEPQTKNYNDAQTMQNPNGAVRTPQVAVYIKQDLHDALFQTVGALSYDQTIGTPTTSIKVHKFFEILDSIMGKPLSEKEANDFINIIALAPYNVVAPIMNNIKTNQKLYFNVQAN